MKVTKKDKQLILFDEFMWSFFPIFTVFTLQTLPPLFSAGILFVIGLFIRAGYMFRQKTCALFFNNFPWKWALLNIFISVILSQGLFFTALLYTSVGNQTILLLLRLVFYYLIFHTIFHLENPSKKEIGGSLLLLFSAGIIIAPGFTGFNIGDALVIVGAFLQPFGMYFYKQAEKKTDTSNLLVLQALLGGGFLLGWSFFQEVWHVDAIMASLPSLVVVGFVFFGFFDILYFQLVKRVPALYLQSLNAIKVPLTMLFAWALLGQSPTFWQGIAVFPAVLGLVLLIREDS